MAVSSPLDHWTWNLVKCPFWCSFSLSDCSYCCLKTMEICRICHQTASLMPPCCSYLLTSDLFFPFHPPRHSLKILIPGSLSLCPISVLISASVWMILKILASLFLCRSSHGLTLHLISATHVHVIPSTLWPRVTWPLQISIQAHYLPYTGTTLPPPKFAAHSNTLTPATFLTPLYTSATALPRSCFPVFMWKSQNCSDPKSPNNV